MSIRTVGQGGTWSSYGRARMPSPPCGQDEMQTPSPDGLAGSPESAACWAVTMVAYISAVGILFTKL